SASAALTEWLAASNVEQKLQAAKDAAATEEEIGALADASGRLFTDSFAPWHRRDGASYAEYLKQLRVALAGEGQDDAE
ncbi:hypothetical protein H4R19_001396, partial [Coemansia spiralis]